MSADHDDGKNIAIKLAGNKARFKILLSILVGLSAILIAQTWMSYKTNMLCKQIGGLTIRENINIGRLYVDIAEIVLSKRDFDWNLDRSVESNGRKILYWPIEDSSMYSSCNFSSTCRSIAESKSVNGYVDYKFRAYPVVFTSEYADICNNKKTERISSDVIFDHPRVFPQTVMKICPLEDYQKDAILFVPQPFTSHKSNSLIRNYIEFSGWRLFRNKQSIPVAEYNQFGINTFFKKIIAFIPNSMGIYDDNSHSFCSLVDNFETREQRRTDLYFEIGRTYRVGRYVRYGEN